MCEATAKPKTAEGPKMAAESAKQFITLSSALLAFTVAFAKEFRTSTTGPLTVPGELKFAWTFYILTIILSLWTLLAATGTMFEFDKGEASNPTHSNIRIPGFFMLLSFAVAIVLTLWAGWRVSG